MKANLSRRGFIGGAFSLAGLAGCRVIANKFGTPGLRFGVVSDPHVTTPESCAMLEKALRYFKSRGADAVMVPGDLTDWDLGSGLEYVKATWDRVFAGTDVVPLCSLDIPIVRSVTSVRSGRGSSRRLQRRRFPTPAFRLGTRTAAGSGTERPCCGDTPRESPVKRPFEH